MENNQTEEQPSYPIGDYRQFQSAQDQASEIQLEMISQSFQDEYAEEASAERKAQEQKDEVKQPPPAQQCQKKKKQNEGDLGGTNGTLTVSEAPPPEIQKTQSQNSRSSSLCSHNNKNFEKKQIENLNQDEIKKAVWPWQHFKSDVTKYKGKLELNLRMLNSKNMAKEADLVEQMLGRIKKFYKKYEKIQELRKQGQVAELMEQAGGDRIEKYKRKIGDEYRLLSKMIQKAMIEEPVKPVLKKEVPDYAMRTRKRDEKTEAKKKPVESKKKKASPKLPEVIPEEEIPEQDILALVKEIKKESWESQKAQAQILTLLNGFVTQFQEQTKQIKALNAKIDKLNKK